MWNTEDPAYGARLEALPNGRYRLHRAKTFASGAGYVAQPLLTGPCPTARAGRYWCCPPMRSRPCSTARFLRPLGMRSTASHHADLIGLGIGPNDLLGPPNAYYRQP